MNTADRRKLGKQVRLMRPGRRHLVRAGPSRADHGGLAPVRRVRGRDLLGHRERISAPDGLAARRRHCRADRHRGPGQGLRRFRERERAAGHSRLPGGECSGEVRPRTSHQSARSERMRTVHSGTGLQHLSHRCPDRAGVSEQYGARRRALSDHSFTRPERRLHARRRRQAPSGRLSHVLWYGEPQRLVGSLAHGHLRQPDRRLAGRAVRLEDRLRHLVAGRFGSGTGHHPAAASGPCLAVSTRGDRHARCARACAPRTGQHGAALAR